MDKEILNFLFSGILSSIIITICSIIYQSYTLKKKRNQYLEEINNKRRKEISNLRLNQIEYEATNIFYWAKKVYLQFPHFSKKILIEKN